jgi:hypothetical protein
MPAEISSSFSTLITQETREAEVSQDTSEQTEKQALENSFHTCAVSSSVEFSLVSLSRTRQGETSLGANIIYLFIYSTGALCRG